MIGDTPGLGIRRTNLALAHNGRQTLSLCQSVRQQGIRGLSYVLLKYMGVLSTADHRRSICSATRLSQPVLGAPVCLCGKSADQS